MGFDEEQEDWRDDNNRRAQGDPNERLHAVFTKHRGQIVGYSVPTDKWINPADRLPAFEKLYARGKNWTIEQWTDEIKKRLALTYSVPEIEALAEEIFKGAFSDQRKAEIAYKFIWSPQDELRSGKVVGYEPEFLKPGQTGPDYLVLEIEERDSETGPPTITKRSVPIAHIIFDEPSP